VAAGVVIAVSFILIGRRVAGPAVQDTSGYAVVGEVVAEQTAQILGGKGQIAVIRLESGLGRVNWTEYIWQGFDAKSRERAGIQVRANETVALAGAEMGNRLRELFQKYGALDAVMLVGGLGDISLKDLRDLPSPRPRIISVLSFDLGQTIQLTEEGILAMGVSSRPVSPDSVTPQRTTAESFDKQYALVTPATVNQLREELKPVPKADSAP